MGLRRTSDDTGSQACSACKLLLSLALLPGNREGFHHNLSPLCKPHVGHSVIVTYEGYASRTFVLDGRVMFTQAEFAMVGRGWMKQRKGNSVTAWLLSISVTEHVIFTRMGNPTTSQRIPLNC